MQEHLLQADRELPKERYISRINAVCCDIYLDAMALWKESTRRMHRLNGRKPGKILQQYSDATNALNSLAQGLEEYATKSRSPAITNSEVRDFLAVASAQYKSLRASFKGLFPEEK